MTRDVFRLTLDKEDLEDKLIRLKFDYEQEYQYLLREVKKEEFELKEIADFVDQYETGIVKITPHWIYKKERLQSNIERMKFDIPMLGKKYLRDMQRIHVDIEDINDIIEKSSI